MTRIIAGFAGSIKLDVPPTGTRPTSDRVREAIFSALQSLDALHGARVLDLYAGTGALGLEAASRGARTVVLVERAPAAMKICQTNVTRVVRNAPENVRPDVTSVMQPVTSFLESSTAEFDLVFIDPPYDIDNAEIVRVLTALAPRLAPEAIIVLERDKKSAEPQWPEGIRFNRSKKYGDTTLWWATTS